MQTQSTGKTFPLVNPHTYPTQGTSHYYHGDINSYRSEGQQIPKPWMVRGHTPGRTNSKSTSHMRQTVPRYLVQTQSTDKNIPLANPHTYPIQGTRHYYHGNIHSYRSKRQQTPKPWKVRGHTPGRTSSKSISQTGQTVPRFSVQTQSTGKTFPLVNSHTYPT